LEINSGANRRMVAKYWVISLEPMFDGFNVICPNESIEFYSILGWHYSPVLRFN
jgi:hypothetical protein